MVIGPLPTGYPSPQTGWQQQLPQIPYATQNGFDPRVVNAPYPSQLGQLAQGVVPQSADWALSSLLFPSQGSYGTQPSYGQPSYGQPSYNPGYMGSAPNTSWYGMLPSIPNPTQNGFSPYQASGPALPNYILQTALSNIPLPAQWALQSLQFGAGGYQQPSYGYPPQQPSYGYPPPQNPVIPYLRSVQYSPEGLVPGQNGAFQGIGPDAGIFGRNQGQQLAYGQNNIPVGPGQNIQANVTPTFRLKQSSFLPNGTRGIHIEQNINTNLRYNPSS